MPDIGQVGINAAAARTRLPLVSQRRSADSQAGELGCLALEQRLRGRLDSNGGRKVGSPRGGGVKGQKIALREGPVEDGHVVHLAVEGAVAAGAGRIISDQRGPLERQNDVVVHMLPG